MKHFHKLKPLRAGIAKASPAFLSFFLFPPSSLPPLPFNHFTPSLALTIWWSSCLWATVRLVRGGQWLAPVQSIKSDMLFTLTWADPVTCTTWCRVTRGCAVDTDRDATVQTPTGAPLNSTAETESGKHKTSICFMFNKCGSCLIRPSLLFSSLLCLTHWRAVPSQICRLHACIAIYLLRRLF